MKDEWLAPMALECRVILERFGKTVFEQKFRRTDGKVDCFFLFGSKTIPVIVFPLTEKNEVIAVRQFRYGANDWVIEVPGGIVEGNITEKSIKESAKRELLEETGFTSKTCVPVGSPTWFDPASFRVSFFPMLALKCWEECQPSLEETEVSKTLLIPFRQWVGKIKSGEICDSKTVAITMMVLCHLYPDHIIDLLTK